MLNLRKLALLLFAFAAVLYAEKVATLPAPTGYINDYANVLSPSGHAELEAVCREVHAKTRAQIFLVTINTLDGESKENFANQLFAKWKIGEKKTDRGILILLAIKDHKYWTEVGYGFEGILNDAKVGDIGRAMVPWLKAGQYDQAARTSVGDIARAIADDAHISLDSLQPSQIPPATPPPNPAPTGSIVGVAVFVFLCFGTIAFVIGAALRRRVRGLPFIVSVPGPGQTSAPTFFNPGVQANPFTSTDSFSSSTSFSSADTSSSSDSFSGGDGGASGGGGAGGDW